MKKFTAFWKWMMIILLSSSVLFIQAQKDSFTDRAPVKKSLSEEQLKTMENSGISAEEIEKGKSESNIEEFDKSLNELKMQDEQNPGISESSSYVEKFYNPDGSITVTLGTGTGTNTTTGNPSPYGTYYKNFRQQYLLLASELMPLGIGAGDITAIGFNVAAVNNCSDMPDFTISIKETSATALTSTFDNSNFSVVFSLPTFLPVPGWNTHTFDTPFTWDGTSNLIIDICTTVIPGAYTQNASVYYTPTTGTNTCARYQSDTQPACLTSSTGTISVNRANMQITAEELLNPPPGMPYNEIPVSASTDIPIDGDLSWTFGNNTDNYDLWFGTAGNMVKVVDNQPAGATGTYTYSGLSYATTYNWQVVATNTNGTTTGPTWSFTTSCGVISSFPWTENFDNGGFPPFCWEKYSGLLVDPVVLTTTTSGWILDDWRNVVTGDKAARVNIFSTSPKYWLMTPQIDLGSGGYQLEFDLTLNQYSTSNPPGLTGVDDKFAVLVSLDGGITWATSDIVRLWDNAGSSYVYNNINPDGETIVIDLTALTGVVKIAFYGESTISNADNDLMVNNVKVRIPPTCPDPSALNTTNITGSSATLLWTSNSGLSDIEFGLAGFTPTGTPTYTGVTSPYDVSGLASSTGYSFYVRDDCGGDYSEWIGPKTFYTACATFIAPFTEHFQNTTIPLCWEISGPQVWLFTNTWPGYGAAGLTDHTATGGSFAGVDGSGTTAITGITLSTPFIDVSALTVPQLRFYLFNNNINNADWLSLSVDLWDGAAWNNSIYFWGPTDNDPEWVEAMVILSAYNITGDIQLRFVVEKSTGSPFYDDLIIDDVYVEEAPTCPAPALLGATFIATTTADLTWTSFSGLSDIEFGLAGFTPTGVPTYTGVVSPYSVTGLNAVTDYSFYVRDDCGSGDYSLWIGPYTFTTQPSCPQPFDLGANNVTTSSADLVWSSFTNLSDVEFGASGFVPTGTPTYTGVTSPYNVSGLNTAAPYDFYVRDDCGSGDYSVWSGPFTFLTSPGTQSIPIYEDFENGFTYFNNPAGNNVDWTINTTYYHSGAQCAHNVYGNTNTNILHETGVLDLSAASVVFLDFWHIAKTEGNYDHCIIEISTDGGLNYTPLPLSTYAGTGNYHVPTANAPFDICFDEDSYTLWGTGSEVPDNATWWQQETFDLSNYLTTDVRIRFRLHSDGSIIRYGWLLDDIFIYEPAYGTLEGIVTDAATSNAIGGADITVQGGYSTTSLSDGTYSIPGILVGSWDVTCSATGYNPSGPFNITIVEDQTTIYDFSLAAPEFNVTPTTVNVTLQPNELLDETINMSNPGLGTVNWSAGVIVIGEKGTDDLFTLQFDYPVGVGGGEAGIETDGAYIYTTLWNATGFCKYGLDGTFIEQFTCGAAGAIRDLAFDGTYFFGSAATTTIFEMDFTNLVVVSTFTAPIAVRAIAYNEDDDAFYGNNWSDNIVKFTKAGANLGSFAVGGSAASYYGFAYDNYSDGAPYLWGYSQTGATQNQLIQMQLPSGSETGVTFDVGSVAAVGAGIAGGLAIDNHLVPGFYTLLGTAQNVDIWGLELCMSGPVWLTLEPTSGTLAGGTNEDMTLHFNATDLLPGVYTGEIHFSTNPNVGSPIVNVVMTVEGFIPPINLDLSYNCTDITCDWEMPAGGTPDSWNVYKDGVLVANVTSPTYTENMVMPQVEFGFYITAVYTGEESMPTATENITVPTPSNLPPLTLAGTAGVPEANMVTLTWNAPSACLAPDGYNVYRDDELISTSLVTSLTYVDTLTEGALYQYTVKAVYYFGESGNSNPAYVLVVIDGTNEINATAVQIFPNPASQFIEIKAPAEISSLSLINNAGELVFTSSVNDFSFRFNVANFESGLYFIKLKTRKGEIIRKISIK